MARAIAGIFRSVVYFDINADAIGADINQDPDSPYIRDAQGNLRKKEHVKIA